MWKRMVAALLTLMLVLAVLPKVALADPVSPEPNPAGATIDNIRPYDTLQNNNGTVLKNQGTVTNNNAGGIISDNAAYGVVTNNYGTVSNSRGESLLYGVVTNNYGMVNNNGGSVTYNGGKTGLKAGTVLNYSLGVVKNNVRGTVINYGGLVMNSTGEIYNYGGGGVPGNGGYTLHQYWKVTINGTAAGSITPTGVTSEFGEMWVLENHAVTLTPKSGFYFSAAPTATVGTVTQDGESYKIEGINRNTEITVNGVATATAVGFTGLAADGGDTETTSLLTLTFDTDVDGLSAENFTVTGATKSALTKVAGKTGEYTLAVSAIGVADNGTVKVAVQKHGYAFSLKEQNVTVRKFTPPAVTLTATRGTRFVQGGAPTDAVFTVTTDSTAWPLTAANFESATLDGDPLALGTPGGAAGVDGSVTTGSVVVTVSQTRLVGLLPGDHTVVINLQGAPYAGVAVRGVITVSAPGDAASGTDSAVPRTGDRTPIALLIGAMLLAGALLTARRVRRREL